MATFSSVTILLLSSLLIEPRIEHWLNVVNDINIKFYNFIWGGKIDRISRNQMAFPVFKGVLHS
jgi:hypothetical protein